MSDDITSIAIDTEALPPPFSALIVNEVIDWGLVGVPSISPVREFRYNPEGRV